MERIVSNLNSITPRRTRFARERLAGLVAKIAEIQKRSIHPRSAYEIAQKLGITKRLAD
jgi:hypothetical protein